MFAALLLVVAFLAILVMVVLLVNWKPSATGSWGGTAWGVLIVALVAMLMGIVIAHSPIVERWAGPTLREWWASAKIDNPLTPPTTGAQAKPAMDAPKGTFDPATGLIKVDPVVAGLKYGLNTTSGTSAKIEEIPDPKGGMKLPAGWKAEETFLFGQAGVDHTPTVKVSSLPPPPAPAKKPMADPAQ